MAAIVPKWLPVKTKKMTFLAKFAHFGTFGHFLELFFFTKPPPKKQKITFLAKFTHFGAFGHFLELFFLPYCPKKQLFYGQRFASSGHFLQDRLN